MIFKSFLAAIIVSVLVAEPACAEPVVDRFLGKVIIRNSEKLDAKTKKELSALAAKIKKIKPIGTVKVIGDAPSAESQDEYLIQSVFIARNVEIHLRKILGDRQQIYITASKYNVEKRVGQNSVEIHLYPYELRVEGAGFSSSQVISESVPKEIGSFQEHPSPQLPNIDSDQLPTYNGLLSPPLSDEEHPEVTSKKERLRVESEDFVRANDLVSKAKARAAEKAKRLERDK